MALAAASTFAGNLFILGAASNVILIQNAEKRAGETIAFGEFARAGTAARLEHTFIGDTVNVASRLESKTKDLDTDIVLSAAALERAKGSLGGGMKFEPLGKVTLKDKAESLDIYKLA